MQPYEGVKGVQRGSEGSRGQEIDFFVYEEKILVFVSISKKVRARGEVREQHSRSRLQEIRQE